MQETNLDVYIGFFFFKYALYIFSKGVSYTDSEYFMVPLELITWPC